MWPKLSCFLCCLLRSPNSTPPKSSNTGNCFIPIVPVITHSIQKKAAINRPWSNWPSAKTTHLLCFRWSPLLDRRFTWLRLAQLTDMINSRTQFLVINYGHQAFSWSRFSSCTRVQWFIHVCLCIWSRRSLQITPCMILTVSESVSTCENW